MRKRLQHLWLYYKWYLIAGAGVLLLLINFWVQKRQTPKPDYYFSIVTGSDISEDVRAGMAVRLEAVLPDRNEDGRTVVTVNLYQYNGRPDEAEDTAAFMAAAVQLAGDLQQRISLCYLTDCEALLNADEALVHLGSTEDSVLSGQAQIQGFQLLCYAENRAAAEKILTISQ